MKKIVTMMVFTYHKLICNTIHHITKFLGNLFKSLPPLIVLVWQWEQDVFEIFPKNLSCILGYKLAHNITGKSLVQHFASPIILSKPLPMWNLHIILCQCTRQKVRNKEKCWHKQSICYLFTDQIIWSD